MRINPNNQRDAMRIQTAIEWSRRKLEPFRGHRLRMLREMVGKNYSDSGAEKKVPLNLIELAVGILTRRIAARIPRVKTTTEFRELGPSAKEFELAINHLLKEIKFGRTVERCVKQALFTQGVAKVGLASGSIGEALGPTHNAGQAYADPVSFDDWVQDMTTKRWEQLQFMGNRYRIPLDEAHGIEHWDTKHLKAAVKTPTNREGDDREDTISQDFESDQDEIKDHVELWDLYFPFDNLIATFPADSATSSNEFRPVYVGEWTGSERGPYHQLGFNEVPGQAMPLSPVSLMLDLHQLVNVLMRKLMDQAQRQKTNLVAQGSAKKDAERIQEAGDGMIVWGENPGATKEVKWGGIDPATLAFMIQMADRFQYMNGNLDALGGLGAQSDTLGQDELLHGAAGTRVEEMAERVTGFQQDIVEDLGNDLWTDPLIDMPLVKRIGRFEVGIPVQWTPERREGDFLQYNIKIDPYSHQHETPSGKLSTLLQTFERVIMPLLPQLEAEGSRIDVETMLEMVASLTNTPEIERLVVSGSRDIGGDKKPVEPRQSPVTTRRYERINRPGATRRGKDQVLSSALLGAKSQGSEMDAVGRPGN